MNKKIRNTKSNIDYQIKKYLFLTTILVIGIISGIIFIFFISKTDKSLIKEQFENIIATINSNKINYLDTFINSITSNLLIVVGIYILSISIIGIPIIIFLLYLKGFTFGLTISSLISTYKFKGLLGSISYLFPHHVLELIIIVLISFHAINFSIRLFRYLFLKENIPLNKYFKNLNKTMILSIIGIMICSLLETFLSPILIDLWF